MPARPWGGGASGRHRRTFGFASSRSFSTFTWNAFNSGRRVPLRARSESLVGIREALHRHRLAGAGEARVLIATFF